MPKRVIDFDAMWASDKIAACAEWAQVEYAWLYGLADCCGCFELTNLRVIWGRAAAVRKNLSLERLAQVFDEFHEKGLLFRWSVGGKSYGHWTGSDVPGRLPPPSWRNRLERLAPPVPRAALEEYVAMQAHAADAGTDAGADADTDAGADREANFLAPRGCSKTHPDGKDDLFEAPRGCSKTHPDGKDDLFEAPRGCSKTHPDGKDDLFEAPRGCSKTHPDGKDDLFEAPRGCSKTHPDGKDDLFEAPRGCSKTHPDGKDDLFEAPRGCSKTHPDGKDDLFEAPRGCSKTHPDGKDDLFEAPRGCSKTHPDGKDDLFEAPRGCSKTHPDGKDDIKPYLEAAQAQGLDLDWEGKREGETHTPCLELGLEDSLRQNEENSPPEKSVCESVSPVFGETKTAKTIPAEETAGKNIPVEEKITADPGSETSSLRCHPESAAADEGSRSPSTKPSTMAGSVAATGRSFVATSAPQDDNVSRGSVPRKDNVGKGSAAQDDDMGVGSAHHDENEGVGLVSTPLHAAPERLAEIWEQERGSLPELRAMTPERLARCGERLRNATSRNSAPSSASPRNAEPAAAPDSAIAQFLSDFREAVRRAAATPFLCGAGPAGWRANFDWIIANDTNYLKVLEGRYDSGGHAPDASADEICAAHARVGGNAGNLARGAPAWVAERAAKNPCAANCAWARGRWLRAQRRARRRMASGRILPSAPMSSNDSAAAACSPGPPTPGNFDASIGAHAISENPVFRGTRATGIQI